MALKFRLLSIRLISEAFVSNRKMSEIAMLQQYANSRMACHDRSSNPVSIASC